MPQQDLSPSTPEPPPVPEKPLTIEERLEQVRSMSPGMERAAAFGEVFRQIDAKDVEREKKRRKAADERLEKLRAAQQQGAKREQLRAAAPDRETALIVDTKRRGQTLMQSDFGTYLKRVADKRGIDFDDMPQRTKLLDDLIQSATRPVDKGYDASLPLYDKDKEGFDSDALEAVNIWSMATLGQQYTNPEELQKNLPEDYQELLRQQANLQLLYNQEIAEKGGERINGLLDGKTFSVDRTKNDSLNAQMARQRTHGPEHTLLLADLDEDTKKALREATATEPTKQMMDEAGIRPEAQERVIALSQMRDPARPQDIQMALMQSADGQVAVDLRGMYDALYASRFAATRTQLPEMSVEDARERARDEANRYIQKMVNLRAPTYHSDPEGLFAAYTRGEGALGNLADGFQILASMATLGMDEFAGDFLDKAIKAGLAPLLPPVKVAGTLKRATGDKVKAGEFGFVSRYLSDNAVTRGIDQFLRVSLLSEGLSSAYAMALEDVIEEKGKFDGEIMDIAERVAEIYGTDEHLFRIASRDDDLGTMMFTLGRAADPTVAMGLREAPAPDSVFNISTVTGAAAMIFGMMFEPDALTLIGPMGHLASKGKKLTAALAGFDAARMNARAASRLQYKDLTGIDASRKLEEDLNNGVITEEKAAEEFSDMLYQDPTGRLAATGRKAEMANLKSAGVEAAGPGQVPSISKDVLNVTREAERAYSKSYADASKRASDAEEALENAPPAALEVAQDIRKRIEVRAERTEAETSAAQAKIHESQLRSRLAVLEDARQRGRLTVDDTVRQGLADQLENIDLMDDAARINFLQQNAVKKIIRASGGDPVEMLARAQALQRTGEGRGIMREKNLAAFAEKLRTSLLATLARPFDDVLDETIATTKAQHQKALDQVRKDEVRAQAAERVEETLRQSIETKITNLGATVAPGSEVGDMLRRLTDETQIYINHSQDLLKARADMAEMAVKMQEPASQRRAYMLGVLKNFNEILELEGKLGEVGAKARVEFDALLKRARKTAGEEGGITPDMIREADEVLRKGKSMEQLLTDMRNTMSTEEYAAAIEDLLRNQIAVRQFYRRPGAVGDLVRSQPSIRGVRDFVDTYMMKAARFYAKYEGELQDFIDTYLTVERGVLDIDANEGLTRASTSARIYARTIGGEMNEYIIYSEKIGDELPENMANLSSKEKAQVNYDRAQRLSLDYLDGRGVIDVKTTLGQEMTLSGRTGDTSPLDHAIDYLVGAARLMTGAEGYVDEALAAIVRSFAADRISIDELAQAEKLATQAVASFLISQSKAGVPSRRIAEQLPDVIRKAWNTGPGKFGSPVSKQLADYRLFSKILVIAAAEGRMLKKVVAIAGEGRHLFSPSLARSVNSFLAEGLAVRADFTTKPVVGDLVITTKAARQFNEALNKGRIVPAPPNVKVEGYTVKGEASRATPAGFPADPRVRSVSQSELDQAADIRTKRTIGDGIKRDLYAERNIRGDMGVTAYRVDEIFTQKRGSRKVEFAKLTDLEGNYKMTVPLAEVTLRDPLVGSFQDAIDGILSLGLSFTSGRQKNVATAAAGQIKRQYSKLVARSIDADGNILYVPRDLSKDLYDALDGLKKDLTDAPVKTRIGQQMLGLVDTMISWHKKAILFGLLLPRAAFATNAVYGDTTQMIIDLNEVPLSSVLRVSAFGALGYIPVLGKAMQRSLGVVGGTGRRVLPAPTRAFSDPATRAVLEGSDQLIEIRRGDRVIKEKASSILEKALDQGAGDNILTSDAMLALRKVKKDPAFGGRLRDYGRLMEIQMREATKAQRVGLFLQLYAEQGMTAQQAGLRMRQALFNWDDAIGASEAIFLGRNFLFYTFIKNAFAQAHRTLFEGYTDNLDEYLKKFVRGRTKLQRLELVSRFSKDFFEKAVFGDPMAEIETPEEAQRRAYTTFMPDYLIEQTLMMTMPLGRDQARVVKAIYGRDIDSVAGVLPKATHIEFLNNYLDLVNLSMIPLAVTALNAMGLTEREVNYDSVMQGLLRHAVDVANPFSSEVIKAFAGMVGIEDPQAGYGGTAGRKVRQYEAVMLTHFGLGDALQPGPKNEELYILPDATSSTPAKIAGNPVSIGLMRTFVLPEYTRSRLLDEINGGYVVGEGSLLLLQALSQGIPGVNPFDDIDAARVRAGPLSIEYTEAQKGWLAARVVAFSEYLGAYKHAFFSGRMAQRYDITDKKQFASTIVSQAEHRGKPRQPIPSKLPKDE